MPRAIFALLFGLILAAGDASANTTMAPIGPELGGASGSSSAGSAASAAPVQPSSSFLPAATIDPRVAACAADPATATAVVPLAHAFNYRPVLPSLGFFPALDALDAPAVLVVNGGMSPIRPPVQPVYPPNGGPPFTPAQPPLPPATSDVCVAVDGVREPFVFEAIGMVPMHPELADAPRQAPLSGEARTVGNLNGLSLDVAWDADRGLLWTVSIANWRGTLTAIDPATHAAQHWSLPSSPSLTFPSASGSSYSIAIDAAGGVWFEASGYNLYRFDPSTERFRAIHLALKTGHWRHFGSYVLAIVPYGDGVVVARRGVPILYRYSEEMRVVGSVPLPDLYVVSREVTRAGSSFVIRGGKWLGLFDILGRRIRQLLYQPTCTAPIGLPAAASDDRRLAAICQGGHMLLLDAQGRAVRTLQPIFDPETEPLSDWRSSPSSADAFATDWHGRWWYLMNGFLVEVHA
jgi:hypothetical protein